MVGVWLFFLSTLEWQLVQCEINETIVLDNAKLVKSLGLLVNMPLCFVRVRCWLFFWLRQDVGYNYINIDDCYSEKERDSNGNIVASKYCFFILWHTQDLIFWKIGKERFPSGMRNLTDQLHEMGLWVVSTFCFIVWHTDLPIPVKLAL